MFPAVPAFAIQAAPPATPHPINPSPLVESRETHLKGVRRLTVTGIFNPSPHFISDDHKLLWFSGRQSRGSRLFDVCVPEWIP